MCMKNRIKTGKRLLAAVMLGILLGVMSSVIFMGEIGLAAEEDSQEESGSQLFDIAARLLASDKVTYDIQLTLTNHGADWEGIVRVQMDAAYDFLCCAYDTALSLPQGSTKQFVVRIPVVSIEEQDQPMMVSLLDQDGNVVADKSFGRFLLNGADVLFMGILSDSYRDLTYLDMGGEEIRYGGIDFPIHLMELRQDNLLDSLESLTYLVIDNYNTSILTDDERDGINQWVRDGGMLIVGTGEYAEDTLSGLLFFGVESVRVNEPQQSIFGEDYDKGIEQLSLAELRDTSGQYDTDTKSFYMISSWGNGAVEFVPYALSDLRQPDQMVDYWWNYIWELLQNANDYVYILDQYNTQSHKLDYVIRDIFKSLGNGGSHMSFGVLKLIVCGYVIFVGPVLYLILRATKRRDWYWGAVPVTVLFGILLVYFAGRGFEVVNTRVYSVTVEKLPDQERADDAGRDAVTYIHSYNAGYKEWRLRLSDRYEYVGPVLGNYSYGSIDDGYYYHVHREGDRIFWGMDPDSSFEDGYFLAGTSQKLGTGSILSDLTTSPKCGITGTVTNRTNRDFAYFAVIADDELFVYDALMAGETVTLGKSLYTSWDDGYGTAMNAMQLCLSNYTREKDRDYDTMAALGTGVCDMYVRENYSGGIMIIGVTKDWDKAADDNCSEIAYGCLYAVQ